MKYVWFHPGDISAHGSYRVDPHALDLPDFEALILGGSVKGHVRMGYSKIGFHRGNKSSRTGIAQGARRRG